MKKTIVLLACLVLSGCAGGGTGLKVGDKVRHVMDEKPRVGIVVYVFSWPNNDVKVQWSRHDTEFVNPVLLEKVQDAEAVTDGNRDP